MKKLTANVVIIIFLFLFAQIGIASDKEGGDATGTTAPAEDAVVAVVNGTKIPEKILDRKVDMMQMRYKSMGMNIPPEKVNALKSKLLSNMIEQEILYQESQKQGITVKPDALESELSKIKTKFPSESEFHAKMKVLGYSENSLRDQIRENLAIQELIDRDIMSKVVITPEAEKLYYESNIDEFTKPEQVHARHILIKLSADAGDAKKAEAKKKIDDILAKLKKGEDFVELVKTYSEGPSAKNGGDLGFFSYSQMVEPFSKAAFALKPGEISGIVTTRFGYYIIKLEERKPAVVTSFDEAKAGLEEQLKREEATQALDPYIENLKKNAAIEIHLPQASTPMDSSEPDGE